ncbi:MAG: transposase [Bacillota bacterium]|nr:transposase [Bacillota bacterium]
MKEIKVIFPKRIFIETEKKEIKISKSRKKKINKTQAQINKIKLIKLTKETYARIGSFRGTAKELNLNRKTVKKYISITNIEEESKFTRCNYSVLDSYYNEIFDLYDKGKKITKIKEYLNAKYKDLKIKYTTLSSFIRKYRKGTNKTGTDKIAFKKIYLNRGKLIKHVLNWKVKLNSDEKIYIEKIMKKHFILTELKNFYELFRTTLTEIKSSKLINILDTNYKNKTINSFIKNLKTDYDAVVNSAKYIYNNGRTEGNVGKLKKIKHDMYGRGGIELLKKKVIFQSFF